MAKSDELKQKSIWLLFRDWRAYDKKAKQLSKSEGQPLKSGALARRVLHEWIEANK